VRLFLMRMIFSTLLESSQKERQTSLFGCLASHVTLGDPMLMRELGEPAVNGGRSSCTFDPRTHPMVMRRSVLIGLTMIGSCLASESVFAAEPQNIDDDFFQQSTAIGALSLLASRLALTPVNCAEAQSIRGSRSR
jgi:hypothetical protein